MLSQILWSQFQSLFGVRLVFRQTLCQSNRLRKMRKNALFPLCRCRCSGCLHCSVKLLEITRCTFFPFCASSEITKLCLKITYFFFLVFQCALQICRLQCTLHASWSHCGIHVCINFNVSSSRIYEFAAVKLKMQNNFQKHSVRSPFNLISLRLRGTMFRLLKLKWLKHMASRKSIAASTTCATTRGRVIFHVQRTPMHTQCAFIL